MEEPGESALPSLSATGWALLGMLSYEKELSGYDIRKWIHWSMRFFYGSPAFSQIYAELKKLEALAADSSLHDRLATVRPSIDAKPCQAGRD